MSNLVRWNPFREIANMQNVMDRFLDERWQPFFDEASTVGSALALDIHENDQTYTVSTELPGVKPEDIHVRLDGDYLVIDGEIPEHETEKEGERWIIKERRYGYFSRRVRLPQPVNSAKIEANYKDGVLKLTLPKSEAAKPKVIPVKVADNGK